MNCISTGLFQDIVPVKIKIYNYIGISRYLEQNDQNYELKMMQIIINHIYGPNNPTAGNCHKKENKTFWVRSL